MSEGPSRAPATALNGKARRHLRALGHHLRPVVQLGKGGLSETVIAALEVALRDHELVKLKLGENTEGDRGELAAALAAATKSEVVGEIGRTILLYRRHPKKPVIELPRSDPKGAKKNRPLPSASRLTKKR